MCVKYFWNLLFFKKVVQFLMLINLVGSILLKNFKNTCFCHFVQGNHGVGRFLITERQTFKASNLKK